MDSEVLFYTDDVERARACTAACSPANSSPRICTEMDSSYVEHDVRQHGQSRQVSLRGLDPMALTQLRATGHCEFAVNEPLFDTDFRCHFLRRLKSVALTVPAVPTRVGDPPKDLTLTEEAKVSSMRHASIDEPSVKVADDTKAASCTLPASKLFWTGLPDITLIPTYTALPRPL